MIANILNLKRCSKWLENNESVTHQQHKQQPNQNQKQNLSQNANHEQRQHKNLSLILLGLFYYLTTQVLYYAFPSDDIYNNMINAVYYLACSFIPVLVVLFLFITTLLRSHSATRYEKLFAISMMILFIDNATLAVIEYEMIDIDAVYVIDSVINGYPFGLIDLLLAFCCIKSIK